MAGQDDVAKSNTEEDEFSQSVIWDDMPGPYRRVVQNVYHSSSCKFIYLALLLANVGLSIWVIVEFVRSKYPHPSFYVIEFIINLVLLSDVILRIWLNGCYRFWHSISNIFEFAIVFVCFLLTIITIAEDIHLKGNKAETLLDVVLMTCLCVVQYIRIGFIISKQRQSHKSQKAQKIVIDAAEDEENKNDAAHDASEKLIRVE